MAEGVSRADSLAIIEELGGWPPPQSGPTTAASAPAVRCRPYPHPRVVDHGAVNARLDSLERVALASDDEERRIDAIIGVGNTGLTSSYEQLCAEAVPPEVRHPGVVARLAALYDRHDDDRARNLIITLMIGQAERSEAVAFLEQLVRRQVPPEEREAALRHARNAIRSLTRMGSPGRAGLQHLHAGGGVRDPTVRAHLEELAKGGFYER